MNRETIEKGKRNVMSKLPRIGVLPLYIALYDHVLPDLIGELEPFRCKVVESLRAQGAEVVEAPVCRVQSEVKAQAKRLEDKEVDLLVTLHLAYSPSLESAEALTASPLPVLMLDTTPDPSFGFDTPPERLLYNHGIHGVQDLASVLRRHGKPYWIVAGHIDEPETPERVVGIAKAARSVRTLKTMRVLRIGKTFAGMGDFQVRGEILHRELGISVDQIEPSDLCATVSAVTEEQIDAEIARDQSLYEVDCSESVHRRSVHLGLGLRQYLSGGGYGAFSMNFQSFDSGRPPIDTVPFLECCKAMAAGIGYAGEGDVLTASLVGALLAGYGETTFTEIFCPDWTGGSLFLSHMGEINPAVSEQKPRLYEKEYRFSEALNPACLACAPRPGPGTFVNLSPGPGDSFRLIVTPVEILGDGTHPDYRDWVRGWIRPSVPVCRFLERFSELGGTHHSALMLGDHTESLTAFARLTNIECCIIA